MLSYKQYTGESLYKMLYEMFVVGEENPNSLVIAFHDKIFIFKENQLEEYKIKIVNEIKLLFPKFKEEHILNKTTFAGLIKELSNSLEDVFIAFISKQGELDIINKRKHDLKTHSLVSKVLNTLKTKKITQHFDNIDKTDFYSPFPYRKNKDELIGYHGTDSDKILNILRIGIRPNQESNWKIYNYDLKDKIFFSTQIEEPLGHANNLSSYIRSENKFDNVPIIVKFKVPDKSKLIQDFDLENMTGKTEIYKSGIKKREVIKDDPIKLSTELGIFGYIGSIYPNHIISLFVPSIKSLQGRIKRNSYKNKFHFSEFQEIDKEQVINYLHQVKEL